MHGLTGRELLEVWERGVGQVEVDRALTLLAVVCPDKPREELASLSLGLRDDLLLGLQETTFGPALNVYAECPKCADRLEFAVTCLDIRSAVRSAGVSSGSEKPHELVTSGYRLRFRLPNSADLAAAASCEGPIGARQLILHRCVLEAKHGEVPIRSGELPEPVVARLSARLAECDPQSEIQFDLECPRCSHRWQAILDIASFLWQEVNALAKPLLNEVTILARAYGWREADILAMSHVRRQFYLGVVS